MLICKVFQHILPHSFLLLPITRYGIGTQRGQVTGHAARKTELGFKSVSSISKSRSYKNIYISLEFEQISEVRIAKQASCASHILGAYQNQVMPQI